MGGGFCSRLLTGDPLEVKFHNHDVGLLVLVFEKVTISGAVPVNGKREKEDPGFKVGVMTVMDLLLMLLMLLFIDEVAVNVTVYVPAVLYVTGTGILDVLIEPFPKSQLHLVPESKPTLVLLNATLKGVKPVDGLVVNDAVKLVPFVTLEVV
jgi:hypothetical protein